LAPRRMVKVTALKRRWLCSEGCCRACRHPSGFPSVTFCVAHSCIIYSPILDLWNGRAPPRPAAPRRAARSRRLFAPTRLRSPPPSTKVFDEIGELPDADVPEMTSTKITDVDGAPGRRRRSPPRLDPNPTPSTPHQPSRAPRLVSFCYAPDAVLVVQATATPTSSPRTSTRRPRSGSTHRAAPTTSKA
jgi:hypothetical protein